MAQNWITTSPSSGTSGTSQVAVSASTNDGDTREQNLTVTATKWGITKTAQVAVKQYSEHTVIVDITGATFGETGGTEQATVTANYPWTATTDSDWITITPSTGTSGDTQITIAASQNTGEERTGTVTISDGTGSTTITVTQESGVHVLSVIPSSASFPGTGGTYVLYVTSNRPWSATTLVPWLDATPSTGASGTSSIVVSATANYNSARNATVIVSDGIASQTIQVSQAVAPSTGITVSPSALTLYDTGGTAQITVSSNYPITASSSSQLVSLSPSTGGSGTTVITLTASTASTGTTGYITVTNGFDTVQVPFTYVESGYENRYLTFVAIDNCTFSSNVQENYSLDNGNTWSTLAARTDISVPSGSKIMWKNTSNYGTYFYESGRFNVEGNIMSLLYGDNFEGQTSLPSAATFFGMFKNCTGLTSAENLILPSMSLTNQCYDQMFYGCSGLTTAPELPATTLATYCYASMFHYCTSLVSPPSSISSSNGSLALYCCWNMFFGCTALTTTPELPATTLGKKCYDTMFAGCSSLATAPELPATTLTEYCYARMFDGCTSLTEAPELPATTLAVGCYQYMFGGCTSLVTAPELPATTLVDVCYDGMFGGCTSLNYIKCMATNGINVQNTDYVSTTHNWVKNVASSGTFVYASGATVSPDSSGSGSTWPRGINGIPTTWLPEEYVPYDQQYITFVAIDSGTFKFSGNSLQYSLDNGSTWTSLASNTNSPTVPAGSKIMWKQTGLTPSSGSGIGTFSSNGRFSAEGNVMSLYYGDNFNSQTSLSGKSYAFRSLFKDCIYLTTAENLLLPATTLATHCYYAMFNGCTSLNTAPELPATTLVNQCYDYMFVGCTSLTTAPELPATTLANGCYRYMFQGCTSLATAPELPATTLAVGCYQYMFNGCTSLTTAPELPVTTLAEDCYRAMFDGCTSLTTAPELPATTLVSACYAYMFRGCTSLTTAPELPATTLTEYCYREMFKYCTSLNYVKCLASTGMTSTYCLSSWLSGVSSSGTFVKASGATWSRGTSGIPTNWTVQNAT